MDLVELDRVVGGRDSSERSDVQASQACARDHLVAAADHILRGDRELGERGVELPAYVIVETDVHDAEQYQRYQQASPAAVEAAGGRFVVRGGELAVLEGDWQPKRLVLLEFEDLEAAKRFYGSPEYQDAKRLREGAANLNMVAVEGIPGPGSTVPNTG